MRCADQSRGTRWDSQKNEVTTFSRDAKINTAAAFNIQRWIADSFVNWLCKTKKKVVVSPHNFLCILISRSLPNLKEMYMTAFRHKLIHNSITQSKASRSTMAATGSNVPHLWRLLHHTQYAPSRWCIEHCTPLHCNNFEFMVHLMIVGLLSTALFQYLKCQDQRISKNCRSSFIFCSSWNLWGGPIFYI